MVRVILDQLRGLLRRQPFIRHADIVALALRACKSRALFGYKGS
jgi:hypothetical protein